MKRKICIVSWVGMRNFGDDWIVHGLSRSILSNTRNVELSYLCPDRPWSDPEFNIYNYDMADRALDGAQLVIFGPGGLLNYLYTDQAQNILSVAPCIGVSLGFGVYPVNDSFDDIDGKLQYLWVRSPYGISGERVAPDISFSSPLTRRVSFDNCCWKSRTLIFVPGGNFSWYQSVITDTLGQIKHMFDTVIVLDSSGDPHQRLQDNDCVRLLRNSGFNIGHIPVNDWRNLFGMGLSNLPVISCRKHMSIALLRTGYSVLSMYPSSILRDMLFDVDIPLIDPCCSSISDEIGRWKLGGCDLDFTELFEQSNAELYQCLLNIHRIIGGSQ